MERSPGGLLFLGIDFGSPREELVGVIANDIPVDANFGVVFFTDNGEDFAGLLHGKVRADFRDIFDVPGDADLVSVRLSPKAKRAFVDGLESLLDGVLLGGGLNALVVNADEVALTLLGGLGSIPVSTCRNRCVLSHDKRVRK